MNDDAGLVFGPFLKHFAQFPRSKTTDFGRQNSVAAIFYPFFGLSRPNVSESGVLLGPAIFPISFREENQASSPVFRRYFLDFGKALLVRDSYKRLFSWFWHGLARA